MLMLNNPMRVELQRHAQYEEIQKVRDQCEQLEEQLERQTFGWQQYLDIIARPPSNIAPASRAEKESMTRGALLQRQLDFECWRLQVLKDCSMINDNQEQLEAPEALSVPQRELPEPTFNQDYYVLCYFCEDELAPSSVIYMKSNESYVVASDPEVVPQGCEKLEKSRCALKYECEDCNKCPRGFPRQVLCCAFCWHAHKADGFCRTKNPLGIMQYQHVYCQRNVARNDEGKRIRRSQALSGTSPWNVPIVPAKTQKSIAGVNDPLHLVLQPQESKSLHLALPVSRRSSDQVSTQSSETLKDEAELSDGAPYTDHVGTCARAKCREHFVIQRSRSRPGKLSRYCSSRCFIIEAGSALADRVQNVPREATAAELCSSCKQPYYPAPDADHSLCRGCAAKAAAAPLAQSVQDPLQRNDPWKGQRLPQGLEQPDHEELWKKWRSSAQGGGSAATNFEFERDNGTEERRPEPSEPRNEVNQHDVRLGGSTVGEPPQANAQSSGCGGVAPNTAWANFNPQALRDGAHQAHPQQMAANLNNHGPLSNFGGRGQSTNIAPTPGTNWMDRGCLLYTSPSPRDATLSRMPSSA